MTPEQLDEIEKLAEADMSEPWSEAESAYVMALQRYALPLVKALREAWALLAALKEEHRPADELRSQLLAEIEAHAETKAEVERLTHNLVQTERHAQLVEKSLADSQAEVERLKAERDEARKWLEGICTEFESTIAHAEWRAAGSKGMSVPFFGDFADAARHPGMIGRMGWWVKVFRAVLNGEKP